MFGPSTGVALWDVSKGVGGRRAIHLRVVDGDGREQDKGLTCISTFPCSGLAFNIVPNFKKFKIHASLSLSLFLEKPSNGQSEGSTNFIVLWLPSINCSDNAQTLDLSLNRPDRLFEHSIYASCRILTMESVQVPIYSRSLKISSNHHPSQPSQLTLCSPGNS